MFLATVALVAALAAQDSKKPLESGLVRSLEIAPVPGTWAQYFRLDSPGSPETALPLALMRYTAGPEREGGLQVDLEIQYLAERVRVFHSELAGLQRRRVVFREVRERAGRTLFLEGNQVAGFGGYELGIKELVRRDGLGAGELPLLLVESVRLGRTPPADARVLDPLAASFEGLRLVTSELGQGRAFEARRADGSLRWRVTLRNREITSWSLQENGPVARSISLQEFQGLLEQNELSVREAREAAARAPAPAAPLR